MCTIDIMSDEYGMVGAFLEGVSGLRKRPRSDQWDPESVGIASVVAVGEGRGFAYGSGRVNAVAGMLAANPGLANCNVTMTRGVDTMKVESNAVGAANFMNTVNPFGMSGSRAAEKADMQARIADDARYTAQLEGSLNTLGKKDNENKATIVGLTNQVEDLQVENEDLTKVQNTLIKAIQICRFQGPEAYDRYIRSHPTLRAMIQGGAASGV